MEDPQLLQLEAQRSDVVINAADYEHTPSVAAFLDALEGTGKTYLHVSGSSIAGVQSAGEADARVFTETNVSPISEKAGLAAIHAACAKSAARGIRTLVIAPGLVYGVGPGPRARPRLFSLWGEWASRFDGTPYLGHGQNIWSNVHIEDLVDLFLLALNKGKAGSTFFAENGQASARTMAEAINREYGFTQPIFSLPIEAFVEQFGFEFTHTFFGGNSRIDSTLARNSLNWRPRHSTLEL